MKKKLDIKYEDKYIIIVNKDSGLLTISRDNKYDKNLYDLVKEYLKKQNPKNKVFIVHRLDKDTQGLIMFAKNEKIKLELQNNWQEVKRKYYCVVEGKIDKSMSLRNYLYETNTHEVKITNDSKKGKYAQTDLEVIKSNNKYTLLDINLITGRKNQIRAQLAYINHPIIGDKKYGSYVKTPLMLQAYLLEFIHPITHKLISIAEKINKNFQKIIN